MYDTDTTLPSSSTSLMILSRKISKRVREAYHPCRTPGVVLKQSPVLQLNKTAFMT